MSEKYGGGSFDKIKMAKKDSFSDLFATAQKIIDENKSEIFVFVELKEVLEEATMKGLRQKKRIQRKSF